MTSYIGNNQKDYKGAPDSSQNSNFCWKWVFLQFLVKSYIPINESKSAKKAAIKLRSVPEYLICIVFCPCPREPPVMLPCSHIKEKTKVLDIKSPFRILMQLQKSLMPFWRRWRSSALFSKSWIS